MSGNGISRIFQRYGKPVTVLSHKNESGLLANAFLQPVLGRKERGRQFVPTELGIVREERFLYLGESWVSLEDTSTVLCDGAAYEVSSAQPVWIGTRLSHWRAILIRKGEIAP